MSLEQRELRLGFIPLTDCAPLAAARELGFFEAEGLSVTLSREASWANIRDKVAMGALDGAHMLGPLPLAVSLGVSGQAAPMVAPLALNQHGAAITVSTELAEAMRALDPQAMAARPCTAAPLKALIDKRRAEGAPPLIFAVVFPFSSHNYLLRYWMAAAGIDPDRDVQVVVVPPPRMNARLAAGEIDGFCAGAPWNDAAVAAGGAEILVHAAEIWRCGADKVLGLRADWARDKPLTLRALLRALLKAGAWCDSPEGRAELPELLAGGAYLDVPSPVVARALGQGEEAIVFHRFAASFPWRSHAVWFLTQMRRWGQIGADIDIPAAAEAVYRPDLYRAAAAEAGVPAPLVDEKVDGLHAGDWTLDEATAPIAMGPDLFFDGRAFDAAQPDRYLAGFEIARR